MMTPPPTARGDVGDGIWGVAVHDPYRWLEDTGDPAVREWVDAQNRHAASLISSLPGGEDWQALVLSALERPLLSHVQLRHTTAVTLERARGADQSMLSVRTLGDSTTARVLVDVTTDGDPTAAVDWFETSPAGDLVAFGTSTGGTERSVLRVVSTSATPVVHDDVIADTRACSIAWEPDGSGFFNTRYPAGEEYGRIVRHHRLGADAADDPVIWEELPSKESWPDVTLSPDGRWLLVHVSVGWSRVDVHLLDRRSDRWTTVIEGVDADSRLVFGPDGVSVVGTTNLEASAGRLMGLHVPIDGADHDLGPDMWTTLVAERDVVLSSPHVVGDEVWLVASRDGVDAVERRGQDGSLLGGLGGLGLVSVMAIAEERDAGRALVLVDRFDAPPSLWLATAGSDQAACWWSPGEGASLTVRHEAYPSLDGTEIGMFLIHRHDVTPHTGTPAVLNGYGGFAVSESPTWSPQIAAWCAAGGLYAVAQLRGGAERGEEWHLAGNRANKQRVFDHFCAAGDWLVSAGLTSRERLAIVGRSNGGLLVGAALTQRPTCAEPSGAVSPCSTW